MANVTVAAPASATLLQSIAAVANGVSTLYVNGSSGSLIVAVNEDTSQTAANRLRLPRPRMFLMPGESWLFVYETTNNRHRLVHSSRDPLRLDDNAIAGYLAIPGTASIRAALGDYTSASPAANIAMIGTANTNEFTQDKLQSAGSGTSAGTVGGITLHSQGIALLGSSSARGGFFVYARARWGVHSANNLGGLIMGGNPGALGATANPSTYNNTVSISWDSTQTTLRARSRDATTTTNVDLGANFPSNSTTAAYEIVLACANGQANFNYFVRRLDSVVADAIGSITTNTPVGTAVLIPSLMVSNNAAAANSRVDWNAFFATGAWG